MSWRDINRRVERAAERMPAPAADVPFDPDVFTGDEIATMEAVAGRYPSDALRRGGGHSALSGADIETLAGIAARIKTRRDGQEAPSETA